MANFSESVESLAVSAANLNENPGTAGLFNRIFTVLVWICAASGLIFLLWMAWIVFQDARPAINEFGWGFLWGIGFLVELIASIPSVIIGLWGIFVLIPVLKPLQEWLFQNFAWFPLFNTQPLGPSMLIAGVILAIMIVPTISAISRDVLLTVPPELRSASMALGATRWETIWRVLLPAASSGIIGAIILGLGRALGETMAVAMVIGNSSIISPSLLAPGYTIPAVLANTFPEAFEKIHIGALMYLALILFVITLAVNSVAALLVQFINGLTGLAIALSAIAILPLFAILFQIVKEGLPGFNWQVFTSLPAPVGSDPSVPNGFANAIVGTLTMVGLASLGSIPLGILTGVFLSEFARGSKIGGILRFAIVVLSSTPSVIVGVFSFGVLVLTTKQFSAVAGAFALGVIMLPIIALTTEEALKLIPMSYRLGSSALGGSRFDTVFRIVLPAAIAPIMTGILLAVARAAGETAPLMFTALFSQFWQESLWSPTPALTVLIYNYASSPFPEQNSLAWTASLVLIILVLITSLLSRFVTRKRSN